MKDNGRIEYRTDMGKFTTKMGAIMRVRLLMDSHLELMEFLFILMVLIKEDNFEMEVSLEKVNFSSSKEISLIKDNGSKINHMVKGYKNMLMDRHIKEDSKMELSKIFVGFIHGKTERFTLDSSDKDILMVREKFI